MTTPIRIKSISEYHKALDLAPAKHPLVSVIDFAETCHSDYNDISVSFDFYTICLKRGVEKIFYGQQQYDFDEGLMYFMSPNQVLKFENNANIARSGWIIHFHPDLLWGTSLADKIKKYEFFNYSVNEALFLSDKEEVILNDIVKNIQNEYESNIDKFSQDIIISHMETLLNYAERFYERQFITRKITNHQILDLLEKLLSDYFNSDDLATKGLPTVQYIADHLNISPSYLRGLLKTLTGQTTQQHIHDLLIEKAKEKLSTTTASVGEIAFELGFEHSQSFSKLFKSKTNQTPSEFRADFN
ncbi:helix-turn-helix domain-containing protein [Zunongwangia sp. HGR-M22]|uniref:helix-turn-helix domain-containing protein n=1 Tax=Zunongwangia sp. HGR-M22 TaxID=3015168 RepID=UPI0022DDE958|nr:helix-turn-helix transcriptional regulator [Zunongwangia sp. HGR-M22]WBL27413.1 helix-turn-helix transcriptional regulator [Zunongwangia sp. HGR-M22]